MVYLTVRDHALIVLVRCGRYRGGAGARARPGVVPVGAHLLLHPASPQPHLPPDTLRPMPRANPRIPPQVCTSSLWVLSMIPSHLVFCSVSLSILSVIVVYLSFYQNDWSTIYICQHFCKKKKRKKSTSLSIKTVFTINYFFFFPLQLNIASQAKNYMENT